MAFWDASAIVPLIVTQAGTAAVTSLAVDGEEVTTWWGTRVECFGALCRLERDGVIGAPELKTAIDRLRQLSSDWSVVGADVEVQTHAERLLRIHPLKSADALQLAACHVASQLEGTPLTFVTLDARLAGIAEKEGFEVAGL